MKNSSRKKRIFMCVVLFVSFFFLCPICVQAYEEEQKERKEQTESFVWEQMEAYDLGEIKQGLSELFPEFSLDMDEVLSLIMQGKLMQALSLLTEGLKGAIVSEFSGMKQLLISILVIGIVSSLFSNFADIFSGQQISQVGFYFLYLFLMAVLTRAFVSASEIAVAAMENTVLFVKLFIPTWFLAVGTSVGSATAVFYYQVMLIVAYLVESFLLHGLLPFIYSYVILALLNGIWAEERLALLLDFIKKGILFAQKVVMGIITGLSLVQAVIVPVLDGLKISAFRKAVSIIPGIGGAAESMTELVIGSAVLIKNSLGILFLLILLFMCVLPVCKLFLAGALMKFGAALSGIVSDKRISGCADKVGEGCFLLLRCLFTSVALFIIVIGIVAYTVR